MIRIDTNQSTVSSSQHFLDLLSTGATLLENPMETADLSFWGRGRSGRLDTSIALELKKSPSDVIASLNDGRIPDQLVRMTEEYDIPYLCTVGEADHINFDTGKLQRRGSGNVWVDSGWGYHYYNSILRRFEGSNGQVRHFRDEEHLAAFILSLYKGWRKEEHSEARFEVPRVSQMDWSIQRDPFAQALWCSGIGPQRSAALSDKFPTMEHVIALSEKEIRAIPVNGRTFGPGNARKLWRFLHEQH